ncbi:arsenate reductase ArsC [Micrococcus terreus]|uniref:arsenate-mycothiol transferase ArsC n=1 Tax=Micrococcus terreus TaxID=574650 RepID=UPI0021A5BABD|nr:arsenate reductase ArsC [Micrococcus terreus]MCT2088378.1 arsenate reductase ArsC [Micrococcus terreus]MDK7699943.1 arsenate reductase ArsC [Micrococcus terreus]WOO98332.1 arsenate reductase ArsC [Micrococcus terreus]
MSEPSTHLSTDPTTLDTHVLQRAAEHLAERYAGIFSPETVERYVFESYATLSRTAKVRTYLASTATHFADNRLRALAQAEGKIASPVPQVLFVCVHNIGRSQIAAALLAHHAGDGVEVRSAGSLPGSEVHPLVVQALRERGVDLSGAYPKPLTDDVVRAADYVITMGCGDACPVYPSKRYLDWEIPDPAEQTVERVREIVADIDARVCDLWAQLQD